VNSYAHASNPSSEPEAHMSSLHPGRILLLLAAVAACRDGQDSGAASARAQEPTAPAFAISGTATSSQLLGRATFSDPKDPMLSVKRLSGDWHVELKARPAVDVAVQSILFPPGSESGWHTHPGPVFIQVVKGTLRFYEGDDPHCAYEEKSAGQGFLDRGEHPHIARNESGVDAQTIVTYLAPQGAALRSNVPPPGNCPF